MQEGGLFSHAAGFIEAKLAYLRARLQLAGIEGKEAAGHFAFILGLAAVALVLVVFGYLFLVIAAVFLVAWLCGGGNSWIGVMFAAALIHLVGAGLLLLMAKVKLGRPVFEETLAEFKKDQLWLEETKRPN